jgi:FixJ family two-component response regulator
MTPVVYLVDDEPLAVRGMRRLLLAEGHDVKAFDSPCAFLNAICADMDGCLLLDMQMPGLNGLQVQEKLRAAGCHLPVIFLTGHGDIPSSVRAMKAGAVDFLCKPVRERDLFSAIQRAMERSEEERERRRRQEDLRGRFLSLTPREREVFSLVVTGMLNKQIGGLLGAAEKTVKVHRRRVMDKMGAASLAQLVRTAAVLEASPGAPSPG